jgi:hypothetical protein
MKHRVPFIVAELGVDTDSFMLHLYAAPDRGHTGRGYEHFELLG